MALPQTQDAYKQYYERVEKEVMKGCREVAKAGEKVLHKTQVRMQAIFELCIADPAAWQENVGDAMETRTAVACDVGLNLFRNMPSPMFSMAWDCLQNALHGHFLQQNKPWHGSSSDAWLGKYLPPAMQDRINGDARQLAVCVDEVGQLLQSKQQVLQARMVMIKDKRRTVSEDGSSSLRESMGDDGNARVGLTTEMDALGFLYDQFVDAAQE
eukprot:917344-Rhodomonas_salina.1